jgi:hypothetical protein
LVAPHSWTSVVDGFGWTPEAAYVLRVVKAA